MSRQKKIKEIWDFTIVRIDPDGYVIADILLEDNKNSIRIRINHYDFSVFTVAGWKLAKAMQTRVNRLTSDLKGDQ